MLAQKKSIISASESNDNAAHCALQAGVELQLQFADEHLRGRYKVTVIGYVEGKSLLITAPMMNGRVMLLREGQRFVVRLLSGKQIIGFDSEVTKVYNNPFPYVHLKPPVEIQQQIVRNAYRVSLNLIATVYGVERNEENGGLNKPSCTFAAKLSNMSTTGCQFQLLKKLPERNKEVIISTKITLVEQNRMLHLNALVRSHRSVEIKNKKWHVYGVEFIEMNDDKRLLLNCFVYEKLVQELFKD